MPITKDYLHFPGSATIEQVLREYRDRQGHWWWLLTAEIDGAYLVCSFGSLLPYLTGRTPHIVHRIGDCLVCSTIDPLLWSNTDALLKEALADVATCSRSISDLPMADLPVIEATDMDELQIGSWLVRQGLRACGVTQDGVLRGVYIIQVKGGPGALPDF